MKKTILTFIISLFSFLSFSQVTPVGPKIPSQSGHAGKYLKTNGSKLSWATVSAGLSASLTANYIPKATASDTIGDSQIFDDGTNVGVGTTYALAKLHIKGIDNTSSNYALKVDNSAYSPLLYVANDGKVGVGTSDNNLFEQFNVYNFNSVVSSSLAYNITNRAVTFLTPNASASYGISSVYDDKLTFGRFNVSGTANGYGFVCGVNGDFTLNADYYSGNSAIDFIYKATTRNIGIRTISPNAALHITGQDLTSSNYALKVDNSASSPLLYVRNDGNVGISTVNPTAKLQVVGLLEYADNAAALAAGLTVGAFYRTGDLLKVVH